MAETIGAFQPRSNRFGDDLSDRGDSFVNRLLVVQRFERRAAAMITGHHYQNAYICHDINAAIAAFAGRADIGDAAPFDVEQQLWTPEGMKRVATKLAFIWIGDLQYELIQVLTDETGLYSNFKDNGGMMHFHHSCMRVADWSAFRAAVAKQDLPVVLERANEGDALKFLYLDGRAFCGHYLEYTWMTNEMWTRLGGPV
jgi:Glyoxalase/Bleomycin resistance protein/Dioxygenase superfamily